MLTAAWHQSRSTAACRWWARGPRWGRQKLTRWVRARCVQGAGWDRLLGWIGNLCRHCPLTAPLACFVQAFKLNVTAVLSQRQRRRLPPLPRPPDHLPGRPVFRLRRWAAAARGRKWPAEDGSAAAAAELQPWAAGPAGTASRAGTPAPPPPAEAATGTAAAGAPAAVAAAAAAAAEAAPFPGERVYISHDVNDEDEYAEEPELASAGITVAELEMAELDEDTPPPPSSSATIDGSSSSSLSSSSSSSSSAAGPAGGAGRGVSPGPAPGGQHALLHCRAHVTMAVRVPGALRVVPNALLGYAGEFFVSGGCFGVGRGAPCPPVHTACWPACFVAWACVNGACVNAAC